jgi:hypothetical protein
MWWMSVALLGSLTFPLNQGPIACGVPVQPAMPDVQEVVPNNGYVKKTVVVEITGKPVFVRCLKFGRTSVGITVGSQTYWLDLHGEKEFQALIQSDRQVVVTGELEELVSTDGDKGLMVNVTGVKADAAGMGASVKKIVKVEIRGKLKQDSTDIERPYDVYWFLNLRSNNYYLLTNSPALTDQVNKLGNQEVIAIGTLEVKGHWNIVRVTSLEAAPAPELNVEQFCKTLIGLDYVDAKQRLTAAGYTPRLAGKDGAAIIVTTDWVPNRVNLVVENGKVVYAKPG